jgi:hypothetical protein
MAKQYMFDFSHFFCNHPVYKNSIISGLQHYINMSSHALSSLPPRKVTPILNAQGAGADEMAMRKTFAIARNQAYLLACSQSLN